MPDLTKILMYVAQEIYIKFLEGDMVDDGTSTISVTDADDEDVDLTAFEEVRLDIFADRYYHSRIYRFSNILGQGGVLVRGDGFFSLSATPFPLRSKNNYKYKLQVRVSTGNYKTLAFGDCKVLNI